MTRASPVKHRVHRHIRSGGLVKVHSYVRGHGSHPAPRKVARPAGSWRAEADGSAVGYSDSILGAVSLAESRAKNVVTVTRVVEVKRNG